ncbi:MAG: CocE/NonD family hydrolase [Acidimicrobiales bacterium]
MSTRLSVAATVLAATVLFTGCSSSGSGTFAGKRLGEWKETSAGKSSDTTAAPGASASFAVQASVNQIAVTDADPGSTLKVVDSRNREVAKGVADTAGSFVFRQLPSGTGYRVTDARQRSKPVTVMDVAGSTPKQSFYSSQKLVNGFQYITTRDGTKLSASVYLPPGDGPFPTVVEYSGYNPSDPTQNLLDQVGKLGIDAKTICSSIAIICHKPAQPSSLLAASMGYAVVAVNVRGTGCSGGSYDFFEPLQLLDGYDVIETAAAQSWAKGGKVGMVGLSYPGISQLFVASTQPPHLAAITPLSVYDDTARGVLAPGGIYNKGFALSWAKNVLDEAKPLGQGWEQKVIDGGDTTCADNQKLRLQNVDAVAKAKATRFYVPSVADPVNPALFADKIKVPVFMTGAWQDEQTGPRFVNLWDKLVNAPVKRFYAFNGAHADGDSPETLVEWKAFLDFYVAGKRTPLPSFLTTFGPQLVGDTFGTTLAFPPERLLDGDFAALKKQYEAEPEVNILWDRGANPANLGAPESTGHTTFASWPPPGQTAQRWFLEPKGALGASAPTVSGSASRWTTNPALADKVTLPGDKEGQAFDVKPEFEWDHDAPGDAAVFVSQPVAADTTVLGGGSADLWIRSSGTNADLGITLSEVRPDGKETYLQSGYLRASMRKPGPNATVFDPDHTGMESDAEPLVPGQWTQARVPILPVGHVLRKGSRLRISIHTPGGDKPRWSWIVDPNDRPTIDIGHDKDHPSSLVLPVVPGVTGYQKALPPCPSLRGQPCRSYQPYANTAAPA